VKIDSAVSQMGGKKLSSVGQTEPTFDATYPLLVVRQKRHPRQSIRQGTEPFFSLKRSTVVKRLVARKTPDDSKTYAESGTPSDREAS
jgi:hypothetical protein